MSANGAFRRRAIERTLRRRAGASEERTRMLHAELDGKADWYATCPGCQRRRVGTVEALRRPCEECGGGA